MPREARLRAAGIPWHVRQRGNNGIPIFADDPDRELFEGLLAELAPRTGCHIHAYALMPNHTHLLVTPDTLDSVPWLMKAVGERYVRAFNKRRNSRTTSSGKRPGVSPAGRLAPYQSPETSSPTNFY